MLLAAACAADDPVESSIERPQPTRPLELTDAASTPELDRSVAAVSLDEIVFDTFDGGSVPLSEADEELVDRLFDVLAPIDAPDYETPADAGWIDGNDLVVGYVDHAGHAWAYPVRVLNFREIVNDELAGVPVVITYCPLCGSGIVFERSIDGRPLSFSNTSALYENDMVMVDRETGSYWWQVTGSSLVGELTGSTLGLLPSQTTTWDSWLEQHPTTQVMERPEGVDTDRDPFATYGERLDGGRTPFPVSEGVMEDRRLEPSTRVVTVSVDGEARAWATAPARIVEDVVGGVAVTVVTDGTGGSVVDGNGVALPSRSLFWFALVTSNPDVTVGP